MRETICQMKLFKSFLNICNETAIGTKKSLPYFFYWKCDILPNQIFFRAISAGESRTRDLLGAQKYSLHISCIYLRSYTFTKPMADSLNMV